MRTLTRFTVCLAALLLAVMAQSAFAQSITNGTLSGVVMDAQKGVLPGATVTAVHVPTGTTYEAVTQADGRFTMPAVRVGGPYTVKATMTGFSPQDLTNVMVGLGESRDVNFTLALGAVNETVTVTAVSPMIDTTRAGTAANIAPQTIETLPTISRGINDFARTSPFFNVSVAAANDSDATLSVAGRNNRYNNMQIDGAVNNDVFGLAASGTPGGQTGTQPVSLDAIQEIQLLVSPYDVRQGGFSGGGDQRRHARAVRTACTAARTTSAATRSFIGAIPALKTPANPDPADMKVVDVQGQADGRDPRRPDRAEQGVLLRQLRPRPQGHPARLLGRRLHGTAVRQPGPRAAGPGHRHVEVRVTTRAAWATSASPTTVTRCSAAPTST